MVLVEIGHNQLHEGLFVNPEDVSAVTYDRDRKPVVILKNGKYLPVYSAKSATEICMKLCSQSSVRYSTEPR